MRNIVVFMHVALDGFVAGPNGEMDWIKVDDDMFAYAGKQTDEADTALYGRVTFGMMDGYWPTAADQPNASAHDKQHSKWYNKVKKVVVSKTLAIPAREDLEIVSSDMIKRITEIKNENGKNILIFGSPSLVHGLLSANLVDDFWLFVNPVLLGKGIPMFKGVEQTIQLELKENTSFKSGVTCLHYQRKA